MSRQPWRSLRSRGPDAPQAASSLVAALLSPDVARVGADNPIRLRPLAGAHREGLRALLDRCSAESLYERFLSHSPAAGPRHVESLFSEPDVFTVVAQRRQFGGGLTGFGSLFPAGHRAAEVALLVADDCQGQGIGTMLAEYLCGRATASGIQRLELTVLAHNHRVVKLFRRCAPAIEFDPPDAGTITATVRLAARQMTAA
jgi:GNAT superfamily N-acetyltransferase